MGVKNHDKRQKYLINLTTRCLDTPLLPGNHHSNKQHPRHGLVTTMGFASEIVKLKKGVKLNTGENLGNLSEDSNLWLSF